MDRRTFLSAGTLALWSPLFAVWAEKEDRNAAQFYRKAFLLLPELTEAEDELIDSVPAALNATGLDLLKRSEPALREMTRAAGLKDCDWDVDFSKKGFDAFMTVWMNARKLAKLACLRAAYSFQQKNSGTAIDDLGAAINMGRHVGQRGGFMATLVQLAIENSVIDVAAAYLPQQNAKTLKALAACLAALPRTSPLSKALQGEKEFLLQYIRPQYENKSIKEAIELLRKYGDSEEEARAIVKAAGGDVKGLLKLIDGAALVYDDLARIVLLPGAEFKLALSALERKHAEDNPLAASMVPGVESMRYAADRTEVRFTMLHVAIKVVLGGTEHLKTSKDPFGDGPFEYQSFKGGFELESKLPVGDRLPATVIVGLK